MANSGSNLSLNNPPIVEAVVDIDCDLPPSLSLDDLRPHAQSIFGDQYGPPEDRFFARFLVESKNSEPNAIMRQHLQAIAFWSPDRKQLVQVRTQGYSFNRLTPYEGLGAYLPEIARTWSAFIQLTNPAMIRSIRLRYINRILVPLDAGKVDLDLYFRTGPKLPDENGLALKGFLVQQSAVDQLSNHQVDLVLAGELPQNDKLPVVFDIGVAAWVAMEPEQWERICDIIQQLRKLKNRVFFGMLTQKCLSLFQ